MPIARPLQLILTGYPQITQITQIREEGGKRKKEKGGTSPMLVEPAVEAQELICNI